MSDVRIVDTNHILTTIDDVAHNAATDNDFDLGDDTKNRLVTLGNLRMAA